jgi:hypothetical protein
MAMGLRTSTVPADDNSYWREQVFQHWELIENSSQTRFHNDATAIEASQYVIDKLEADDWRRVRQYNGRARFSSFISIIISRLLEDFSRKKFGRIRPPRWLEALGRQYLRTFQALCQARLSIHEAIEQLCRDMKSPVCEENVEEAAAVILARLPHCGQYVGEPIPTDMESLNETFYKIHAWQHLSPESYLCAVERAAILEAVCGPLLATKTTGQIKWNASTLTHIRSRLNFSAEDYLFLQTIYVQGLNVSAAGRLLDMDANRSHSKHKSLLKKIHRAFEQTGLEAEIRSLIPQPIIGN